MSPNREDYLKMLFKLEQEEGFGCNKDISKGLGVSPASVTEMIRKLKDGGLVRSQGQKLYLTEEGTTLAKDLISRHRLWETFLMDKLGYLPSEVHEAAEILEHVTDETLISRLNEFLGRPEYCPHGGAIYRNGGELPKEMIKLTGLLPGEEGRIVRIFDRDDAATQAEALEIFLYDSVKALEDGFEIGGEIKKPGKRLAENILIQKI